MKVVMLKEGMERTGEYVNRLLKAKEDGLIDIDAYIPTATDILLELIKKAKNTPHGNYVIVQGLTFIRGQDYELQPNAIDLAINELRHLRDTYIILCKPCRFCDNYEHMKTIINNRINELIHTEATGNNYIYNGELKNIK